MHPPAHTRAPIKQTHAPLKHTHAPNKHAHACSRIPSLADEAKLDVRCALRKAEKKGRASRGNLSSSCLEVVHGGMGQGLAPLLYHRPRPTLCPGWLNENESQQANRMKIQFVPLFSDLSPSPLLQLGRAYSDLLEPRGVLGEQRSFPPVFLTSFHHALRSSAPAPRGRRFAAFRPSRRKGHLLLG